MKVLTIFNITNGSGKTTIASNLAVAAFKNGLKIILIDMDENKKLEIWWKNRKEEDIHLLDTTAENLENSIRQLREKNFDLCIIDTPGHKSQSSENALKVADLVIIPCEPTASRLSNIGRSLNLVETLKKKFVFILNKTTEGSREKSQAISALSMFGAVAPAFPMRVVYNEALETGVSASELDSSVAGEISLVWEFLKIKLFGVNGVQKEKLSLTEDLVKIEEEPNEPSLYLTKTAQKNLGHSDRDRINMYIDKNLKEDLQIYCVRHKISMTDVLEGLLREFLKN